MKQATPFTRIGQWAKWAGGMLVAWVLILGASWMEECLPVPERQTYVCCASAPYQADNHDCSSTGYHQQSNALVIIRGSFTFLPALGFFPTLLSFVSQIAGIEQVGGVLISFFLLSPLRSILEHQIAPNAP